MDLAIINIELDYPLWLVLAPAIATLLSVLKALKWIPTIDYSRALQGIQREPLALRSPLIAQPKQAEHNGTHTQTTTQLTWANNRWNALRFYLLIALLSIALSQPIQLIPAQHSKPLPADLIFVVDTSLSMVLQDYSRNTADLSNTPSSTPDTAPQTTRLSRLEMTQWLLDRFVQNYRGQRLGLIVYGDQAHALLQPTSDFSLIRHWLKRLRTTMAGRRAATGDAIALANKIVKQMSTQEEGNDQQQAIILITDGSDTTGALSPSDAALQSRKQNIQIHTIAIGAIDQQQTANPTDTSNTTNTGKSDLLFAATNLSMLRQLSTSTNGLAFHATNAAAMDRALIAIEAHTRSKSPHTAFDKPIRQSLAYWPLLAAALVILLTAITSRTTRHRHD